MTVRIDGLGARFGPHALGIVRRLRESGHDAVIVGGPVRDTLLGFEANDVDIATSARPDEVRRLFRRVYTVGTGERHGTIGVLGADSVGYEVTTFRRDIETDGRHAVVAFSASLEEDLVRRDFTMNAMAIRPDADGGDHGMLIDPHKGRVDLSARVLRAVGEPHERFREDYLRILRAYRMSARFGLTIESVTRSAIRDAVPGLTNVSCERVRDEILKMLGSTRGHGDLANTLRSMMADGVLEAILPEVTAARGVTQNRHHAYDVFGHLIEAAEAGSHEHPLRRFALLLHDIGKPATRAVDEEGVVRFLGHEIVGAEMTDHVCRRFRLSASERAYVVGCVRWHMELMSINRGMTPRQLRRIAARLSGGVTLDDLIEIRIADKRASGVDASLVEPAREAEVRAMIREMREEAAALRVTDLAIRGSDVIQYLDIKPGPEVGRHLARLLEAVIDSPELNTRDRLLSLLDALPDTPSVETEQDSRPVRSR